jgi:hypothetical protein
MVVAILATTMKYFLPSALASFSALVTLFLLIFLFSSFTSAAYSSKLRRLEALGSE